MSFGNTSGYCHFGLVVREPLCSEQIFFKIIIYNIILMGCQFPKSLCSYTFPLFAGTLCSKRNHFEIGVELRVSVRSGVPHMVQNHRCLKEVTTKKHIASSLTALDAIDAIGTIDFFGSLHKILIYMYPAHKYVMYHLVYCFGYLKSLFLQMTTNNNEVMQVMHS
jgi:hypothetical protein